MREPRLLDLFCCSGGAARGYQRAGFRVHGVDIAPQPRYIGDAFTQADVLGLDPAWVAANFDAVHASPPCQVHSVTANLTGGKGHVDLIPQTRALLLASGLPFIIENVPGAPLIDPIILCGTMFGLRVYRHRLFECSFWALTPPHMPHQGTTNANRGYSSFKDGADMISVAGHNFRREDGAAAMGIDWPARREEIAQAIPPAYTEFLGRQLMAQVVRREAA